MRIGLALSGGGLRATLYHLGVVRYLKESGVLPSITHITSVSGGSILGAHLVLNWDRYNGTMDELDAACQEVLDFVRMDVRNRIVRRYPFVLMSGFMQRAVRQRPSRRFTRTGLLETQYRDFLFGDTCLHQLPVRPELHVLCTNLSEGVLSSFTRSGLIFEDRSRGGQPGLRRHRAGLATVPMAVAASSAFPGFFPPLELTADDIGATEGEFQTQYFTDGGVYDNLGVRMFRYLEQQQDVGLDSEDFRCAETAVAVWNSAAKEESRSSLRRIAEIYAGTQHDVAQRGPDSHIIGGPGELATRLQRLITDTNLVKDPQLQSLLELDRYQDAHGKPARGNGHGNGNGNGKNNGNGNGNGKNGGKRQDKGSEIRHIDRIGLLAEPDRVTRNRRLLSLAFREASGRDLLGEPKKGFDTIIVSDAGKKFQVTRPDRAGSFLRTAMRSSDILMDRVWQLEKDHFGNSTDYIFVPITTVVSPEEDATALHPEVQIQVGKIRTDMDSFTDDEVGGLICHGYCVARQAIAARPSFSSFYHDGPPWDPTRITSTSQEEPIRPEGLPGSRAVAVTQQARRLQQSSRRIYFGSFFSFRDWVSYLYVPLLILLFGVVPYLMYGSWHHGRVASSLTSAIAETRDDYKTLLHLLEYGPVGPWQGMPFRDAEHPDPLFAEQGLDIIADARIVDLRRLTTSRGGEDLYVYVYRAVSVRKVQHSRGLTGLQLQSLWDMPEIHARCRNPELKPVLQRCVVASDGENREAYSWQLELDFSDVPVGHTTNVIVEALLPLGENGSKNLGRPWWEFEVDADPEVATSWLLLPKDWKDTNSQLVRFNNDTPEILEVVEPTHHASMSGGSILHWIVVHPKADYTYTYRWDSSR